MCMISSYLSDLVILDLDCFLVEQSLNFSGSEFQSFASGKCILMVTPAPLVLTLWFISWKPVSFEYNELTNLYTNNAVCIRKTSSSLIRFSLLNNGDVCSR